MVITIVVLLQIEDVEQLLRVQNSIGRVSNLANSVNAGPAVENGTQVAYIANPRKDPHKKQVCLVASRQHENEPYTIFLAPNLPFRGTLAAGIGVDEWKDDCSNKDRPEKKKRHYIAEDGMHCRRW